MKTVHTVAFMAALCALGCKTAPERPDEVEVEEPTTLELGAHPHWVGTNVELPESLSADLDANPVWEAHVGAGVDFELWPGGARVRNTEIQYRATVVGWDAAREDARVRIIGPKFAYYPTVARGDLMDHVTTRPSVVYSDRGVPFARIPRARSVDVAAEGGGDDRLLRVCLGERVCWAQGYVLRSDLGDIFPANPATVEEPASEPLASLRVPASHPKIILHDDTLEPIVSAAFTTIDVLERGEEWSAVSTSLDGIELRGKVPTAVLESVEERIRAEETTGFSGGFGVGGLGFGRGSGGISRPDVASVRLERGGWLYASPSRDTGFARLNTRYVWLPISAPSADGWTKSVVTTPWGLFDVYVQDADVVERHDP